MESAPHSFYRILRLKHVVGIFMEEALGPAGLTSHQYTVLSLIRRMGPVNSAELARKLQISAQSMGESLKALEGRGLISRNISPLNRRIVLVALTVEGKKTMTKGDRLVAKAEERFFDCLTPDSRRHLEESLATLRSQHSVGPPEKVP